MDNCDACHFQKLLPFARDENKMVAIYRMLFLPTILSNWFWSYATFGIRIVTPISGQFDNNTWVKLSYGLCLCQLAQELRQTDQGTEALTTTCCAGSCSFPDLASEIDLWNGNNPVASEDAWNTTNNSIIQKHHRDIQEGICQAWNRGAWPAAVPRHSCVIKSNLSAESKPVQCALLQHLHLSITPHEYLVLGKGGKEARGGTTM